GVKKCLAAPKRQSQVTVHSNPTDGRLKIESGKLKIEKAEIFDIFGVKIFETTETTFGIRHLPQGVYIIKICLENNNIVTRKIVRQ
ncbi:MAG: T9SS type A sorting domain-containing protein, partial [Bacteroidales bacterium]|nr:T9SS type A sorting domain-containing protein [Bacteroidales bacterium]